MKTITKRLTPDSLLTLWTAVIVYVVMVAGALIGGTHHQAFIAALIGPAAFLVGGIFGFIAKRRVG